MKRPNAAARSRALRTLSNSQVVLGFVALSAGDPATAHVQMEPYVTRCVVAGVRDPELFRPIADDIEALTKLGRWNEAEIILEVFEDTVRSKGSAATRAIGMRCRAMILAARGELAAALALLTDACFGP